MGGSTNDSQKQCGMTQLLIFLAAIVTGTACSLCSKLMMDLHSTGVTGETEKFSKPIFQTFGMFIGMTFGIVMHWIVLFFKIPFPGYVHEQQGAVAAGGSDVELQQGGTGTSTKLGEAAFAKESDALLAGGGQAAAKPKTGGQQQEADSAAPLSSQLPVWMYFFLGIPSVFDLGATALCMMGLQYLDVSIYQMLRGSGIIFVALMKQHVLGDHLYKFQWVGVLWNVVSVVLVGLTAMLATGESDSDVEAGDAVVGVFLVMAGAFVQALQFVFEEKVMTMDIPAPPLLLIGMEGVWGTFLCLAVVYPLAYYLPGDDHGSYEDPFNTYEMFMNSATIQWAFVIYFFTIFGYNLFAVLVTFMLSSVWHAILDNFRPITVWATDMFIFYVITAGEFGEPWTRWSFIQLIGMFVLLYGTSIYNAPNAGSISLTGKWWAFFLDFTSEYEEVKTEELDAKWEEMQKSFRERTESSFYREHSPYISVHTQALRGFGSPKI